jgi:YbbR domain-containing protein
MKFFSAFREWLLDDFLWKFFSVILAVVIWLTVHRILVGGQAAPTSITSQGVTYENLPVLIMARAADVHNYHVQPETVSVTVNGTPEAVSVLQANSIRVSVDLSDIDSAKDLFKTVDVSMPPGITLVKVSPARVTVLAPPPPKH